jgi:hypothetical protein
MSLYRNTRIWRLVLIFWLFLVPGLLFGVAALAGLAIGNVALMVLGFILAPLLLLSAGGIALFARSLVLALTRDGDMLTIQTWGMRGGASVTVPFASANLGEEEISESEDVDDDMPCVTVATAMRRLHVAGRKGAYIIDCTDQPELSLAVAAAFRRQPGG